MLKRRGIKHNVLNAKYHELEAEIVAQAGIHDAVTIATNMAGRGTAVFYTHLDVYKRQVMKSPRYPMSPREGIRNSRRVYPPFPAPIV